MVEEWEELPLRRARQAPLVLFFWDTKYVVYTACLVLAAAIMSHYRAQHTVDTVEPVLFSLGQRALYLFDLMMQ